MVSVEGILKKASEDEYKAQQLVTVQDKQIDLTYDLGHLAAFDTNRINFPTVRSNQFDEFIKCLTRDNTQLIINKIWNLKTKRVDNVITGILPMVIYNLPRAKPIPKGKAPTKWELFARSKGIRKKNKERMIWDPISKQWKSRYGYRSIAQQKQQNEWLIEVPDQSDPNADYFAKKMEQRSERISKNELKRLRNIARSQKLPGTSGVLPDVDLKKNELIKAKCLAKKSTASIGKFFNDDQNNEQSERTGIKRKFESNFKKDFSKEIQKNLVLAEQVLSKEKNNLDNGSTEKANAIRLKKIKAICKQNAKPKPKQKRTVKSKRKQSNKNKSKGN